MSGATWHAGCKESVPAGWHVGQAWSGTEIEDACPCPKAPCGLIDVADTSAKCHEHPIKWGKSIRQGHEPGECPAIPTVEEPHHRAARQPTDEERAAARRATLDAMRAGLSGLQAKAAKISARNRGGE
jgi:hypothetical protein